MEPKKYEYLDSLRGIAVIIVVWVHVSLGVGSFWEYFPTFMQIGMTRWIHCVQLFFIVSAFTLTMSYYNRKEETHATRNFVIRRFFRIAPMYYIAILYSTFDGFLGFDIFNLNWENFQFKGLVSSIFFLNGLFPAWINSYVPGGWTITVEFMFYFTMPFICRYINNLNKSIVFVLITLLFSSLLNFVLEGSNFDKYDFLYYYFPNQLPVFAMGIMAYFLIKENVYTIKSSVVLFFTGVFLFYCFFSFPTHIVDTVVFVLLILILSKRPYKFLTNKILATVGQSSFSLYLIHFAILNIFIRLGWSGKDIIDVTNEFTAIINIILLFSIIFGVSFVISQITYRLIELPGQNIGRKLIKRINIKHQ